MCVCLYQKSVCKVYRTEGVYCGIYSTYESRYLYSKVYRTCLQSSATGFLMPDQRHFLSLYSYSLDTITLHWSSRITSFTELIGLTQLDHQTMYNAYNIDMFKQHLLHLQV